jgi:hypothetical protein
VKFNLSMKYQIGGREVTKEEFFEGMTPIAIAKRRLEARAVEVAQSVRCETHGKSPTITLTESGDANLGFSISGCCDELRTRTAHALGARPRKADDQPDSGT